MSKRYQAQANSCTMMYKMTHMGKNKGPAEQGFVAIFSVLIIMAILTLLTIGFSNVARQAQRNTLDNQLSTQAFYAAESGINDAARAILLQPDLEKTECDTGGPGGVFNYTINAGLGVGYTCVLIDATVTEQVYDSVPPVGGGEPVVTVIEAEGGGPVPEINFEWDSIDSSDPIPATSFTGGSPTLPSRAAWGNNVGIVRVDLIPISGALDRASLVNNSYTFFLYPRQGGAGSVGVLAGPSNQAGTAEGNCVAAATYRCRATVTVIPAATRYVMRLQSYYNPVKTSFDISNGGIDLIQVNGQAIVDVTGQASDVFRRIQVRLPLSGRDSFNKGSHIPFSLLSGDSICKRLASAPGDSTVITSLPDASCLITE